MLVKVMARGIPRVRVMVRVECSGTIRVYTAEPPPPHAKEKYHRYIFILPNIKNKSTSFHS